MNKLFSRNIRISEKNIIFNDKKPIKVINKILISNRESYDINGSFEYFIGYDDKNDIRSLRIMLPQMFGSIKCFKNGNMSFEVVDKKLLKMYTKIWKIN